LTVFARDFLHTLPRDVESGGEAVMRGGSEAVVMKVLEFAVPLLAGVTAALVSLAANAAGL
jgi:hypothetical protein